ncbi:MAG: DNA recombination protein RmuC [Gammaproteobacteria bacterium]
MTAIWLFLAFAALALGAALGYLFARTRAAPESARLQAELASSRTALEQERGRAADQLGQLDARFRQLSSDILEDKSKRFTEQNRENLEGLLRPLRERLTGFENQVKQTYEYETRDRIALKEQIAQLQKLNQQVSSEANALATALKGQSKTRGNWGELVVERILELSGLVEGREYDKQVAAQAEDGGRRVPDFVVHLPGGRDIVIDSKLALNAYLRATAAPTEEARGAAMAEHAAALRNHVRELAGKDYTRLYGITSLDFVLMCVPNEAAYVEALTAAPGLFEEAFAKKIVLVSPSNLWPTLKAVESMWRLERQNENAAEIARRGGSLLEKLYSFVDDLMEIDKHLKKAADAHAGAMNKLSTGKGNLVARAEQMRKLGVAVKKQLPLGLQKSGDNDDDDADGDAPPAIEDRSA